MTHSVFASDLGHAAFILEAETAMFAKAETLWRPIPKGLGDFTCDQKGSFEVANLSSIFGATICLNQSIV